MHATIHALRAALVLSVGLLLGCGTSSNNGSDGGTDAGNGSKVEDYVPASGEIAGWTEDTSRGQAGVEAAYTVDDGVALIDGALDPFVDTGKWVSMAIEYYMNGDNRIQLSLFEMQDAAGAAQIYNYLEGHPEGTPWETSDISGADESRIANQGAYWQIHAIKGKYLAETLTEPRSTETESVAKDFAAAVLDKLP
ncbi:MAG: hypothetical protein JXR96_17925 [Deltaproteobacteria bacterium]|nr:hypothetical protein [Deltaproteobacteria bacterium]